MVLWQCSLRVSWYARCASLLLHGAVILALLLAPWPARFGYILLWAGLLILVALECLRSQRRIVKREGDLALLPGHIVRWCQQQWQMPIPPWVTRQAILLSLHHHAGQRERLWLFADGMESAEWRLLRQQLLMNKQRATEP